MRVTVLEQSQDRLVVRTGPWWGWWRWVTLIRGWVLTIFGLLALVGSIDRVTLRCERAATNRCDIAHWTLFGTDRRSVPVPALSGTALRESVTEAGETMGRAVVLADGEDVLFAEYGEGEASEMRAILERVDRFIQNLDQAQLEETFSHTLTGLFAGGLTLLGGWLLGRWGQITTTILDRPTRTMQVRRKRLFTTRRTRPLDTSKGVDIRSRQPLSGGRRVTNYVVDLVFKDGRSITLDSSPNGSVAQSLAEPIRAFVGEVRG